MKKMGYFEDNMDSRLPSGSVSSASEYSLRSGGANINPFCPCSSSKLTHSIIKDHMMSHYKKVYSAKAAIDTSVPKSLLYSVKYNDQLKQAQLRKCARPQSAHSLSLRSQMSCSPAKSGLSLQYDDYPCSRSSMASTPRLSTSFHPKNVVYPSFKGDFHCLASESKHRTLETSIRQQSAASLEATRDGFISFQDPAQKTYSGDLLQKHSQSFTKDKPFTPKTLKSHKGSYLSKYRYYRAPQKKSTQDSHNSSNRLHHQEPLHKSTSNQESTLEIAQRSQGFITDYDLSEDNFDDFYLLESRQNAAHKNREHSLSSRASYEGRKSPTMKSINAEEEEQEYLQFITAVTDDILSIELISDSIVDHVINRHIDMNRYHLDKVKMRHLLDVFRKDLQQPTHSPVSTLNLEREDNRLLDRLLLQKVDLEQTKENEDHFQYESLIKNSIDYADPILTSSLISETERTSTLELIHLDEKGTVSPQHSRQTSFSEEGVYQNRPETEKNKDDINQSEENTSNRVLKVLDEVGAALESLNVSDHSHCGNTESEVQATAATSDDDQF